MADYNARATGGLTTGIIGTSLGALNSGLLGNLFGGNCCPAENMPVNRYEAGKDSEISELRTEVKLRDANFYTQSEMGKLRDYVDRRFDCVNTSINQQAVINAQVAANLSCMQGNIATLMGLTKTIIPIGNICPSVMPEFNSWVAPTATTATP